jgi:hypothetical protein
MVVDACNPCTLEPKGGGSHEFKASLGEIVRHCLKNKMVTKRE